MKEFFTTKPSKAAIGVFAACVALGACGEANLDGNNERYSVTQTVDAEGSEWTIRCEGPVTPTPIEVEEDDTLLELTYEHTDIVQPAGVGRPDMPIDALVEVVAEINELDNPDQITVGQALDFPRICSVTTPQE